MASLDLHDEGEHRAAFVTAEAVEDLLRRTDGKRRRLFLVERAARHPVRALFLELHVVLYDPDDVCLSFEVVDECLGVTHLNGLTPKALSY
jgi:catechol 2,3-dioxygenase-like lactoylglutathione lyase family enzyme